MILDPHRQGLGVSAIARRVGIDRKTVRKSSAAWSRRSMAHASRGHGRLEPFEAYLRQRVVAYPSLTGSRLPREIREQGYDGGYTAVTDFLREVRPRLVPPFEVRFETSPGIRLILRSSRWSSPTSQAWFAKSGCSRWCLATAG